MARSRCFQLLDMDRKPTGHHLMLEFGEIKSDDAISDPYSNDHYIKVEDSKLIEGQNFVESTSTAALNQIREKLEKQGFLIAMAGSLIYFGVSRVPLQSGGYHGYNYKNFDGKSIPTLLFAFDVLEPSEYVYVATLRQQSGYYYGDADRFQVLPT